MAHIVKEESGRALVDCAFCSGKGLDPFGIMSHLSTCYACLGHKQHRVKTPIRECLYCHGAGVSPIGARNYCIVCRGRGVIASPQPSAKCPACGGSARHEKTGFYCYTCRGSGVVEVSATEHHGDKGDKR